MTFFLLCLLALLFASPLLAQPQGPPVERLSEVIPHWYVVQLNPGVTDPDAVARDLAGRHGIGVKHIYRRALRGFSAFIPPGKLRAIEKDPRVRVVGKDRTIHADAQIIPTGIDRIDAEPGFPVNLGSGIDVAIIDTGSQLDHPDLALNIAGGVTLVTSQSTTTVGGDDDQGHGTHVAGTVAAINNAIDVVGVGPEILLWPVKVLGSRGSGSFADVIAGIDWVADVNQHGGEFIEVVNMSLGATCSVCTADSTNTTLKAFRAAIQNAINLGTTFVVSAGNSGANADHSVPAAYPEVITVSALYDTDGAPGGDSLASFSNYGSIIDVIAPGVSIRSTRLGGGTTFKSGTSMSSPHATGVAALIIYTNPGVTPDQVRNAMRETGECPDGSIRGASPCAGVWSGDPDGISEPLVNAERASQVNLGPPVPTVNVSVTTDKAEYEDGTDTSAVLTAEVSDEAAAPITGLSAVDFSTTVDTNGASVTFGEGSIPGTYSGALDISALGEGTYAVEVSATDTRPVTGSGTTSVVIVPPEAAEPDPPEATMHVNAITLELRKRRGRWQAKGQVTVVDGNGARVAEANVALSWTLNDAPLSSETVQSKGNGKARTKSALLSVSSGAVFKLAVTDITKAGLTYNPADNVETEDSITVP